MTFKLDLESGWEMCGQRRGARALSAGERGRSQGKCVETHGTLRKTWAAGCRVRSQIVTGSQPVEGLECQAKKCLPFRQQGPSVSLKQGRGGVRGAAVDGCQGHAPG